MWNGSGLRSPGGRSFVSLDVFAFVFADMPGFFLGKRIGIESKGRINSFPVEEGSVLI